MAHRIVLRLTDGADIVEERNTFSSALRRAGSLLDDYRLRVSVGAMLSIDAVSFECVGSDEWKEVVL